MIAMRKPIAKIAAIAAIALAGVVGGAWFAMGDRQSAPVEVATAQTVPLKPSYIVAVRAPTPAEQAQRDALAKAKPSQSVIDLRPSAPLEVAEVSTVPTGPLATVLSDVNVRSGPSKDSATLSVASAGSKLAVVGQEGSWTQVTLPDGGNGWIATRFLQQ
jgi:hypothetical protein